MPRLCYLGYHLVHSLVAAPHVSGGQETVGVTVFRKKRLQEIELFVWQSMHLE
jgi:hypothetical protein